jgi:uncharacterized protein
LHNINFLLYSNFSINHTVPTSHHPLRFNVGFLSHVAIGTYRDLHFDFPKITFSEDMEVEDFTGVVRLNRTPQGILIEGEFSGKTIAQCVRCLADFLQPVKTNFEELYAFSQRTASDADLIIPDDANIDIGPLVRDYLLIEVPINTLCRPDCRGLCQVCGEDLNLTVCEHADRPSDTKLASQ